MKSVFAFVAAVACLCGVVSAQFESVPTVYTQSPDVFRAVFARSRCQTVNVLVLGDSQETTPGGGGAVYVPRWQYRCYEQIGNAPGTPWAAIGVNTGGGSPYADWLIRTAQAGPGFTATQLSSSQIPPGFWASKTSFPNGNNVNNNQVYGNLIMLQHDCANVHPGSELNGLTEFFDRNSNGIKLEFLAATGENSGEVLCRFRPTTSSTPSYAASTLATFSSSLGLENPEYAIRRGAFGPFDTSSLISGYAQVELAGTDATKFTDIVAARYVNVSEPEGWIISSLSKGGYKSSDLLAHHADCGEVIDNLDCDVAFICYGANDCAVFNSTQFRQNVENLIAFVRLHTQPNLPIILISDPLRTTPNQTALNNLNAQPGVHYAIAQSDPYVCSLNSRLLTHNNGWDSVENPYLIDGVHYTSEGGNLKADLEAEALFGTFLPLTSDCNANGVDDYCDLLSGVLHDEDEDGTPDECEDLSSCDYNQDGGADNTDASALAADIAAGTESYPPNSSDFNNDGGADNTDITDLSNAIASGTCP